MLVQMDRRQPLADNLPHVRVHVMQEEEEEEEDDDDDDDDDNSSED